MKFVNEDGRNSGMRVECKLKSSNVAINTATNSHGCMKSGSSESFFGPVYSHRWELESANIRSLTSPKDSWSWSLVRKYREKRIRKISKRRWTTHPVITESGKFCSHNIRADRSLEAEIKSSTNFVSKTPLTAIVVLISWTLRKISSPSKTSRMLFSSRTASPLLGRSMKNRRRDDLRKLLSLKS